MRRAAETFPPAEYLADELAARGWSADDFATQLDVDPEAAQALVSGRQGVTRELAQRIGVALGTSVEMWLRLERRWQYAQLCTRYPR